MKEKSKFVHRNRGETSSPGQPGNTRQHPGNTRRPGKPENALCHRGRCRSTGTDVFSVAQRSAVMAAIRGRGNRGTELRLIAIFRAHQVTGWRRHRPIIGKPDFVFPAQRVAVFVDGCFWHGCPKHATWPKQNAEFWRAKILHNRARDREVNRLLKQTGWRVVRIWEHALTKKHAARTVARLQRVLAEREPGRKRET
ncbi:very short patch repair endonuclease [Horticoccus luteus]|uniref:Very short patch repair endonuclease n=1 Tax=Horticoccus luteus TaxID=2862869 RepID=A0A8F9XGA1_9BACT|nr:very short patch repair endonuclease [Horticoccus luteus]